MSGKMFDPNKGFEDYMGETENFGFRLERLYEDMNVATGGPVDIKVILQWMRAAYICGAHDASQDTLNALLDYATATAGCEEGEYGLADCFDKAHDNLLVYYTAVYKDVYGTDEQTEEE